MITLSWTHFHSPHPLNDSSSSHNNFESSSWWWWWCGDLLTPHDDFNPSSSSSSLNNYIMTHNDHPKWIITTKHWSTLCLTPTQGTTFHQREIMDKKEENSNRYTISNECLDIEFLYIQPSAGSSFEDVQPEVCVFCVWILILLNHLWNCWWFILYNDHWFLDDDDDDNWNTFKWWWWCVIENDDDMLTIPNVSLFQIIMTIHFKNCDYFTYAFYWILTHEIGYTMVWHWCFHSVLCSGWDE